MMNEEIEVILTDIGGVIFKSYGIKKAISQYLNEGENVANIEEIMSFFYSTFTKNMEELEFWNKLSEIANVKNINPKDFFKNLEYRINYEYLDFLKELSNQYTIGIVSDINSPIYNFIKKEIKDFKQIFNDNYIFLSYLLGDSKFERQVEFFARLKNDINISSKKIIYIDDHEENIDNAICNGFLGLKYDNEKEEIMANNEIIKKIRNIVGED